MISMVGCLVILILFLSFFNWYLLVISIFLIFFVFLNKYIFNIYYSIIRGILGGDLLSFSLIFLRIWIIGLMILASGVVYKHRNFVTEFLFVNIILLLFLVLSFGVYNLFIYYLFFECSLIPTVFLIFGWGYQPERLISGYYLLFYTLFFSLPILLGIFYIDSICLTIFYYIIVVDFNFYIYLSITMAFLVKMPLVFVHF